MGLTCEMCPRGEKPFNLTHGGKTYAYKVLTWASRSIVRIILAGGAVTMIPISEMEWEMSSERLSVTHQMA